MPRFRHAAVTPSSRHAITPRHHYYHCHDHTLFLFHHFHCCFVLRRYLRNSFAIAPVAVYADIAG